MELNSSVNTFIGGMKSVYQHLIFYPLDYNFIKNVENTPGVYMIKNILNGKTYIGSSFCLRRRLLAHLSKLKKGSHRNKHLLSAFNKYGQKSFVYCILEKCEPIKDTVLFLEQKYLDLKPEYNVAQFSTSNKGFHHSDEVREKIRNANIGRCRPRKNGYIYKSAPKLKNENYINKSRLRPVYQYSIDGEFIKMFSSASEAGRELNVGRKSICDTCHGKQNSAYGYRWYFEPLNQKTYGNKCVN